MEDPRLPFATTSQTEPRRLLGLDQRAPQLLAQIGLWICTGIAVYCLISNFIERQPFVAIMSFVLFFVGGCGIRRRSILASALVTTWQLLGMIGDILLKLPPNILGWVFTTLLLLHFGFSFAVRKSPDSSTSVSSTTLTSLTDALPARIWRYLRWPYLIATMVLVSISLYGTVMAKTESGKNKFAPIEKVEPTDRPHPSQ